MDVANVIFERTGVILGVKKRPKRPLMQALDGGKTNSHKIFHFKAEQAPIAQLVECQLRGTGHHGFDPAPRQSR